jgi:hypothetical protein
MDALSRGASPPGMIDMIHTRHTHLSRRFTMIARYDGRTGRWSATGLALSLLIAGVSFTGAVNGQDAAPAAPGTSSVSAAQPGPAQPAAARETKPATPRGVQARGAATTSSAAMEQKLWNEKYQPRVIVVDGKEVNRETIDREYLAELDDIKAAARHAGAAPDAAVASDEDVDAALLARLDRKLPEASFDGAGLSDVIDFLRDVSGANMVVEWGHLANAGVERNAPVTLRVRDVKFSKALDLILSSAAPGVPVGYSLDGNIIRVSTREHLDGLTDVRAYDVRDILASEAQMTDLTKLITESVAPDTWRNAGGSIGVILPTRNKLVVTQTPMNHRQIRSVLQMLREDPREPARAADAASAAQAPAGTRN